jgi:2-polyprenyl-3-methyl-5-hydroxy-6-metoxy-1,4-benzoquinol methylase
MEPDNTYRIEDLYNKRYLDGYRETLGGYENARSSALDHFITKVLKVNSAKKVLDYGSGSGLYVDLWRKIFPLADLFFCDISRVSLEKLVNKYPEFKSNCRLVKNSRALFDNSCFDVVLSIEVMEHVQNLDDYLKDVHRLIKPGGIFVWTTPCANRISIEHVVSMLTKNIESTNDGYRRWKWEDPTHLRRLRSDEVKKKLQGIGFETFKFRFRAHLFSYACTRLCKWSLTHFGERLMLLDYIMFRKLPNGASMIGGAGKLNTKGYRELE